MRCISGVSLLEWKQIKRQGGVSMKRYLKTGKTAAISAALFLFLLCLPWAAFRADAEENGTRVMTIQVKSSRQTAEVPVYARESSWYGTDFYMESSEVDLVMGSGQEKAVVSIRVDNKAFIDENSLSYKKEIKYADLTSAQTISFKYTEEDTLQEGSIYYSVIPHVLNLSFDNCYVSKGSKGFHPSKKNYLPIQTRFTLSGQNMQGKCSLRIRILNAKGKYVYQKSYNVTGSGYLRLEWNGKASKNNAGVKKGSYVKDGKYKVEFALIYSGSYEEYVKDAVEKVSFTVSRKASGGTKGVAAAKEIPMLTGISTVDYMAEKMVKSAGVKSGDSDDAKVRKIYHYMTKNFKHVHYGEENKRKFYNITSASGKKKVAAYQKKTDKLSKKNKLIYNYFSGAAWEELNMVRRSGVCTDHAYIFVILCNHVGVNAGVCNGYYLNLNGTRAGHSWNYAIVNGVKYYYDIDVEIQNYGKGQGDYYWYKKTLTQAKKTHQFM